MSSMTDSETYNGYANRETWAFNLHWQNDQGLYNETLETAREFLGDAEEPEGVSDLALGAMVVEYVKDLLNEGVLNNEAERMIRDEVGSWWRIDCREVGEAVRESLDAES